MEDTTKKILKAKTYTIEEKLFEDGTKCLARTNDGFNPLELLGLMSLISLDITKQIAGKIKPTIVKRIVVE